MVWTHMFKAWLGMSELEKHMYKGGPRRILLA